MFTPPGPYFPNISPYHSYEYEYVDVEGRMLLAIMYGLYAPVFSMLVAAGYSNVSILQGVILVCFSLLVSSIMKPFVIGFSKYPIKYLRKGRIF